MFLVINKEKLGSYIVSIATVVILFVMAGTINPNENTIETGVNIQNTILNNNIDEKKDNTSTDNYKNKVIEKTE